jgi:hypothetical protein
MHTVVTELENKPNKVRCNTCKTERTYKPVKDDAENTKNGGTKKVATDREEEFDIDSVDVQRVFQGDAAVKKKAKPKAKAKKSKDSDSSSSKASNKNAQGLPLSMLGATSDDLSLFEAKLSSPAAKNPKDYKISERFNQGEVVNHKTFGIGFVVAEVGTAKVEVLFGSGRKLLVTIPKN